VGELAPSIRAAGAGNHCSATLRIRAFGGRYRGLEEKSEKIGPGCPIRVGPFVGQAETPEPSRSRRDKTMNKYLLLYRSPAQASAGYQPSPDEMQQMMAQWEAWKDKFKANILEMGDGLLHEGRVLQPDDAVTDGPFIEAKEVIGGFSIIQAENYDQALEVSRACPVRHMPGNSVEIRPMAGY
jgi:hypothetical protein